ncbi:MAG: hypothetical protein D6739_03520 [Nitrospirae bacterium]|nr:MAG: hypothetical protein D6739_03520 [Nitrospirota bacterium]
MSSPFTVGILAYGSLVTDPGEELAPLVAERRPCRTPFPVEFARLSPHRGHGPVLTVVPEGEGDPVAATLLVLRPGTSVETATRVLWRRETHQVGSGKIPLGRERRAIRLLMGFEGIDVVLYWQAEANYPRPDAAGLARRAIESARTEAGAARKDGISYLAQVVAAGIRTRLTEAYVAEVLAQTGAEDLEGAWRAARGAVAAPTGGAAEGGGLT